MLRRTLQLVVASLSMGSSAFAADLTGSYSAQTPQGTLSLSLHQEQGRLTGTVNVGNQQFPIVGQPSGNQLVGSWSAQGGTIPFTASMDGTHLVLSTNGVTYQFDRNGATPSQDAAAQTQTPAVHPSPDQAIDQLVQGGGTMNGSKPAAYSSRWDEVVFPDNTGSVSVPDDWRLVAAQSGSAGVFGPNGEIVALGQRLSYSSLQVPYHGPVESARIIWTKYSQTFSPPVKFVQILGSHDAGITTDGAESAEITFTADVGTPGSTRRMTGHMIIACNADARGNWKGIYSAILAPSSLYETEEPAMARIWNSFQLNGRQVIANTQADLQAQIDHSRQSWAITNAAVDRARRTMNASGRQVEDFCNTMGGTGYAVDNRTGRLVPLGHNTVQDLNIAANGTDTYSPFHVTPNP